MFWRFSECRFGECHFAKRHFAGCRGTQAYYERNNLQLQKSFLLHVDYSKHCKDICKSIS
jgi:hypothetical protein